MEFKEDVIDIFNESQRNKNEFKKEETEKIENLWSQKLTKMLNKRTQTRNSINSKDHYTTKSILKKTLKEFSVEYYKPIPAHQKRLKFRNHCLHLSQKQKFRNQINRSIQHKLKEKQAPNSITNEHCSNVIFVGKNKVMIKSIVENEKNHWKRKKSEFTHRKNSQGKSFNRKSMKSFPNDLKNMSEFSKTSFKRPRTISLIQLPMNHFLEKTRGKKLFHEDLGSKDETIVNNEQRSWEMENQKKVKSTEVTSKLEVGGEEEKLDEEFQLKKVPKVTKSLESINKKKEEENKVKSNFFDEYNLEQVKINSKKISSMKKNEINVKEIKNEEDLNLPISKALNLVKNSVEILKEKYENSSKSNFQKEELEEFRKEIKFDETPKTQNTINQSNFGVNFGESTQKAKTNQTENFGYQKQIYNASEDVKSKEEWGSLRNMETINESNEPKSYANSNFNSFIDDSQLMGIHSMKRDSSRRMLKMNKLKENPKLQQNFRRILETGKSCDEDGEADGTCSRLKLIFR